MTIFKPSRNMIRDLANTPDMSRAMVTAATPGIAAAEAIAPRRRGEYARSFVVEAVDVEVNGQTRSGARLTNTAEHSGYVEWVDGYHVLARIVPTIESGR